LLKLKPELLAESFYIYSQNPTLYAHFGICFIHLCCTDVVFQIIEFTKKEEGKHVERIIYIYSYTLLIML